MFQVRLIFIIILAIVQSQFLCCGEMRSSRLHFTVGKDMIADGNFVGKEAINLQVGGTLKGNGYFKSPIIELKVKTFAFTGTIECDGYCTITTAEPFEEEMFTRVGSGVFTIIVDPNFALEEYVPKIMPARISQRASVQSVSVNADVVPDNAEISNVTIASNKAEVLSPMKCDAPIAQANWMNFEIKSDMIVPIVILGLMVARYAYQNLF